MEQSETLLNYLKRENTQHIFGPLEPRPTPNPLSLSDYWATTRAAYLLDQMDLPDELRMTQRGFASRFANLGEFDDLIEAQSIRPKLHFHEVFGDREVTPFDGPKLPYFVCPQRIQERPWSGVAENLTRWKSHKSMQVYESLLAHLQLIIGSPIDINDDHQTVSPIHVDALLTKLFSGKRLSPVERARQTQMQWVLFCLENPELLQNMRIMRIFLSCLAYGFSHHDHDDPNERFKTWRGLSSADYHLCFLFDGPHAEPNVPFHRIAKNSRYGLGLLAVIATMPNKELLETLVHGATRLATWAPAVFSSRGELVYPQDTNIQRHLYPHRQSA